MFDVTSEDGTHSVLITANSEFDCVDCGAVGDTTGYLVNADGAQAWHDALDAVVPAQRDALPSWVHDAQWTTDQAAAYVGAVRGIAAESGRRWLTRNAHSALTGTRQIGREGQNLYRAVGVRRLASLGMARIETNAAADPLLTLAED